MDIINQIKINLKGHPVSGSTLKICSPGNLSHLCGWQLSSFSCSGEILGAILDVSFSQAPTFNLAGVLLALSPKHTHFLPPLLSSCPRHFSPILLPPDSLSSPVLTTLNSPRASEQVQKITSSKDGWLGRAHLQKMAPHLTKGKRLHVWPTNPLQHLLLLLLSCPLHCSQGGLPTLTSYY